MKGEEQLKSPEELELDRKRKDSEEKKRLDEERKEELRPKLYSKEEVENYQKFVEDISNEFTNIIMRHMNMEEDEEDDDD